MENLGSLKRYLQENQELPWQFGYNREKASKESESVWLILSLEDRLVISCHNPFRTERNEALGILRRRGLKERVLSELSGLGRRGVQRVIAKRRALDE